jgi:phosphate transport system substrate-binding protein
MISERSNSARPPLGKDQLDKHGLAQFPTVMGGVVPVVNIEGVNRETSFLMDQRLPGSSSARSRSGMTLNDSLKLTAQPIVVVHRAAANADGPRRHLVLNYFASVSSPCTNPPGEQLS